MLRLRYGLALVAVLLALASQRAGADSATIAYGLNLPGIIGYEEVDTLSFSGSDGDRIIVFVLQCSDFGGRGCCCFDQKVRLISPSGDLVAETTTPNNQNCCGCHWRSRIGDLTLEETGLYSIFVQDILLDGHGDYSTFLQRTNEPERTDALKPGDAFTAWISMCGEVDTYILTAAAGQRIQVQMLQGGEGSVDPRIELYDMDGRLLESPGSGTLDRVVSSSGAYTLLAFSSGAETGTYALDWTTPVFPTSWGLVKAIYR